MAFDDTNIPVVVKTDTTQLRQMISDFKGTREEIEKLGQATASVKEKYDAQRQAITAYNQAQRINNFEIIESLRLVRSFTSVFRDLNQVYSTLILKQISSTQTTVAQRQAFDRVTDAAENIVNALDILGPANDEVKQAFDDLITKADGLNSTQLAELITNFETAGNKAKFSADEQAKFNEELQKLKDLLEETKMKEKQKELEDFFGLFTQASLAAGSIGTFALNLAKFGPQLTALAGTLSRFAPEIAIIIVLLFGPEVAKQLGLLQTTGESDLPNIDAIKDITSGFSESRQNGAPNLGNIGNFFERLGDPNTKPQIVFNIDNVALSNEQDIYNFATKVTNMINQEKSKKVR